MVWVYKSEGGQWVKHPRADLVYQRHKRCERLRGSGEGKGGLDGDDERTGIGITTNSSRNRATNAFDSIYSKQGFRQAYCDLGDDYWRTDNWDNAIAAYTAAIRLDPNCSYAYHNRGVAYSHKDKKQEAAADFAEANRINDGGSPVTPQAHVASEQPTPSIQSIPRRESAVAYHDLGDDYWGKKRHGQSHCELHRCH